MTLEFDWKDGLVRCEVEFDGHNLEINEIEVLAFFDGVDYDISDQIERKSMTAIEQAISEMALEKHQEMRSY